MKKIGWNFPKKQDGYAGFNEAGIETFAGDKFHHLAREVLQNSLDAAKKSNDKVTVEFNVTSIPVEKFPDKEGLLEHVKGCQGEEACIKDIKASKFFKRAEKILSSSTIPCLKIKDRGTTGLRGDPNNPNAEWYAFVKGSGINVKQTSTAGGSFGIGKNAPFVVSQLRTVFYSTRFNEGDECVERAQGKSVLMSRRLPDRKTPTSNIGFYGIRGEESLIDPLIKEKIPEFLQMNDEGTTILVTAFSGEDNWQNKIIVAVISNFFYAIHRGQLEVMIQTDSKEDSHIIDKDSLPNFFEKSEINSHDAVKDAKAYYNILSDNNRKTINLEKGIGSCSFFIKVSSEEDLPCKVALLRNTGMLITDEQKGMKRWNGVRDFAAICICDDRKGNELLRRMENPQHNAFEPDRLEDPKEIEKGDLALKELVKEIRKIVRDEARIETEGNVSLDELSQYFPDRKLEENLPGDGDESDLEGLPFYQPRPIKKSRPPLPPVPNDDGDDGPDGTEGSSGGGDGEGGGDGDGGGAGDQSRAPIIQIIDARIIYHEENTCKRTIKFTPSESGKASISLDMVGDSETEKLHIQEAFDQNKKLKINRETAFLANLTSGKRASFEVILRDAVRGAILISARKISEK